MNAIDPVPGRSPTGWGRCGQGRLSGGFIVRARHRRVSSIYLGCQRLVGYGTSKPLVLRGTVLYSTIPTVLHSAVPPTVVSHPRLISTG
jgi:hypothetical protein